MKNMKKIISFLLTCALLLTCAYSAFALDVTTDGAIADDGTYKYKPGDIDNDGAVTAGDARAILRYAVYLYDWDDIAAMCYNAKNYNYKLAADVDYDGVISSADARLALRVSVGLETIDYEDVQTLTTKQQIIDFYDRAASAVKCGGNAGFTKTAWQTMTKDDCNIIDICNGKLVEHVNTYITAEGEATGVAYSLGSCEARTYFPNFTLNDYSKVKSATCTVNTAGNYVITLVMEDSDTTYSDNGSFIYDVTDQHITWKEDVEPVLDASSHIKNWKGENIITKNFTIIAELTPNGKFVSLTHKGDAVLSVTELTAYQLLVIPVTYKNKSATVHTTTVYNNFNYSSCFKGISCKIPAAYGSIESIGEYLGECINNIAYYSQAGYTVNKTQSIDKNATNLSCITNNQAANYLNPFSLTTTKGTVACWTNFPPFDLCKYDWVKSAICSVNEAGNYVFVMTFHDVDTSKSTESNVLQAVTDDLIYFDEDIAPILRDMNSVKSFDGNGTVTYKDFTITAEITTDGQIVYMEQTATVEVYTSYIKTLLITHDDQSVTLKIKNAYSAFTY